MMNALSSGTCDVFDRPFVCHHFFQTFFMSIIGTCHKEIQFVDLSCSAFLAPSSIKMFCKVNGPEQKNCWAKHANPDTEC